MLDSIGERQSRPRPSYRIGGEPTVLREVLAKGANIAVWERALPEGIGDALAGWAARAPAEFEADLPATGYTLTPALRRFPTGPAREWLLGDIAMLLGSFVALAQPRRMRVFFGAVRHDQCRKFHVDYLGLRLITTYLGPGTEWAPDAAVRRKALIDSPGDPGLANAAIIRRPSSVRHARAGDVLVMKGNAYPGVNGRAVVHRSPPIEHLGLTRVVLVATADRRSLAIT